MNKVYTKFLLQWVTNVVVAVTVEMVYVPNAKKLPKIGKMPMPDLAWPIFFK